jgi:phosphoserine phosphatase RsbU/P
VGDVSGKGMKAAMTAVMVSGMLNTEAIQRRTIRPRCSSASTVPCTGKVTGACLLPCFTVSWIRGKKQFSFTNAGQMPPLLLRDGKVATITSHGPRLPLGVTPEVNYARKTLALLSGDHLLLYTDGINEARNGDRYLFGEERLAVAFAASARASSASEALEMILSQIRAFTGEEPPHDDITMVLVRVR